MLDFRQPFQNKMLLYTMHFFFAFVSRIWQIGIVLLLAQLTSNSLFFVALSGLFSSCCIFFCSSSIGDLFDQYNRMTCMSIALLIKMISVSIGYFLCGEMLLLDSDDTDLTTTYQIYSIPIICAIADLSFSMITMNIEKDWVVVLSNGNSAWLSTTNSVMTQIDLSCNAISPIVAGVLFSFFDYDLVAFILLGVNAVATLGLYIFLNRLYHSWETLSIKSVAKFSTTSIGVEDIVVDGVSPVSYSSPAPEHRGSSALTIPMVVTPTLLGSGCAGAMISYSLLYLTVLSFGSLMLVYLKWCGIPDHWIGVTRGLAAISGFAGAWIYPSASQWIGLKYLAKISIWWQSCLVLIAALGVFFSSRETGCWIMIVAVLLSRVGLWCFDLCIRQIAQETIAEAYRGIINGKWNSMTAFFDLSSYLLAVTFSTPEQFGLLTLTSALMVCSACVIFTVTNSPPLCGNPSETLLDNESGTAVGAGGEAVRYHRNYGSTSAVTTAVDDQF